MTHNESDRALITARAKMINKFSHAPSGRRVGRDLMKGRDPMPATRIPKLLDADEAAAALTKAGVPTAAVTVRRRAREGAIPSYKINGRRMFSRADLAEFVAQSRRPARS